MRVGDRLVAGRNETRTVVDEYPSPTVVTLSGYSVSILSSTQFDESGEALSCVRCEERGRGSDVVGKPGVDAGARMRVMFPVVSPTAKAGPAGPRNH